MEEITWKGEHNDVYNDNYTMVHCICMHIGTWKKKKKKEQEQEKTNTFELSTRSAGETVANPAAKRREDFKARGS